MTKLFVCGKERGCRANICGARYGTTLTDNMAPFKLDGTKMSLVRLSTLSACVTALQLRVSQYSHHLCPASLSLLKKSPPSQLLLTPQSIIVGMVSSGMMSSQQVLPPELLISAALPELPWASWLRL
ncbi:hypothetical protein AMECASPLE_000223 [Ameca splendens]|uniref:Uncharacterized protein n=1 Tax=Ameca splendens TaxID=208324 RepID=A0ABV0Y8K0_9TELE